MSEPDVAPDPVPRRVARSATKGVAVLGSGRVVALGLQFVSFAVMAASLGPAQLGVYSFAIAFVGLFRWATNMGFRPVVAREVAQQPEREHELVAHLVWLRFLLGAAAYLALVVAVFAMDLESAQRQAALLCGAVLVFLSLESFEITLEVRLRTGWITISEITKSVLMLLGVLVLSQAGAGPVAYVGLYAATSVLRLVLPSAVALAEHRFTWRPDPRAWVAVVRVTSLVALSQLFVALYYRVDMVLLARMQPSADLGQYGVAYQFLTTFVIVPSLVMTLLNPVLSRSVVEGADVLQRRFQRALHLALLVGLPVAVAGALTASRLLPRLPGFGEYAGAGDALALLSPAALCIFLGMILSAVLISGHRQRFLFWLAFAGLVFNVAANLVLIPTYTFRGAAAATSATEALLVVMSVVVLRRWMQLRWPWRDVLRASRASVVLACVLVLGWPLHPFVQVALGVVAYVVVLLPTRSLEWRDLGGLMGGDGPPVRLVVGDGERPEGEATEVTEVTDANDDGHATGEGEVDGAGEVTTVDATGPLATLRAIRGASACTVVGAPGAAVPLWVPAVARVAGCAPVVLEGEPLGRSGLRGLRGWFARRWLLDEPQEAATTGSSGPTAVGRPQDDGDAGDPADGGRCG